MISFLFEQNLLLQYEDCSTHKTLQFPDIRYSHSIVYSPASGPEMNYTDSPEQRSIPAITT